jgi:hypothetical protein
VAAAIEAAHAVDRVLERGHRDGQLVWLRIKRAIEALQAPPSGGAALTAMVASHLTIKRLLCEAVAD